MIPPKTYIKYYDMKSGKHITVICLEDVDIITYMKKEMSIGLCDANGRHQVSSYAFIEVIKLEIHFNHDHFFSETFEWTLENVWKVWVMENKKIKYWCFYYEDDLHIEMVDWFTNTHPYFKDNKYIL